MQKRVALARALVTDPTIVLFDEPNGPGSIRKNMILSMIVHYRRKFGFTAIMISHDIPDVFFISDGSSSSGKERRFRRTMKSNQVEASDDR